MNLLVYVHGRIVADSVPEVTLWRVLKRTEQQCVLQLQRVKAELHKQLCSFNLFQPTKEFLPSIFVWKLSGDNNAHALINSALRHAANRCVL